MKKNISVIIPTYNRAHHLAKAVDSVFCQTYKPFEIIIVDDGSTDNTKQIVSDYADKVVYISQKNSGPSAARNRGIRAAQGDFIAFLDSDDAWAPEKLEKQVNLISESPKLGLIGTGYYNCDQNLENPTIHPSMKLAKTPREEILIRNLWPTPSLLIRKSCFEAVGLFNENMKFAEDWDMWVRISQIFPVATINEPLVMIRKHDQGLAGLNDNQEYNFKLWKDLISNNRIRYSMCSAAYRKAMSLYYLNRFYSSSHCGDFRSEFVFLSKSLFYWPFYLPIRLLVLLKMSFNLVCNSFFSKHH